MKNKINKFILIGGVIGFLFIFWDYDFLLNPGGPTTTITYYILDKISFDYCCWDAFFVASSVMVLLGSASGALFGWLLKLFSK